ncbi:MAG: patatin-like phospholipase family protein [Pseudohongiella sp.]|nr:patatin-like phospholipase family protein [Pseudohongiella sp.]MDP2126146.1 patatin-like phospholipase family protein [Pseudohongiella sp.]
MSDIRLFAGPKALEHLQSNGLRPADVSWLAGASGGPKWFVLYGIDRYLAGEFFVDRQKTTKQTPLRMIGSSAGAWRLACYAHSGPVAALQRLADRYSRQTYSERPDIHEISREARLMLDYMLGDSGAVDITGNPARRLYVITDRAKGWVQSDNRLKLNAGLLLAAISNMADRRLLGYFFERHVFHNEMDVPDPDWLSEYPTQYRVITAKNVREVLMATGSIPQVMERVTNMPGNADTVYRDGGITDYHLDLPFNQQRGLVLYPHFYAGIVPGWFDKFAAWRRANPRHFDNVLLISPSLDFVRSLPYGKIPDRNDFKYMPTDKRIDYWHRVLGESERLAQELRDLVNNGKGIESIQPITTRRSGHV